MLYIRNQPKLNPYRLSTGDSAWPASQAYDQPTPEGGFSASTDGPAIDLVRDLGFTKSNTQTETMRRFRQRAADLPLTPQCKAEGEEPRTRSTRFPSGELPHSALLQGSHPTAHPVPITLPCVAEMHLKAPLFLSDEKMDYRKMYGGHPKCNRRS
jgi:hypothetical protein